MVRSTVIIACIVALVVGTYLCGNHRSAKSAQETTPLRYLSPIAVVSAKDGNTLYVAEATAKLIAIISPAEKKITNSIAVPEPPNGLVLSPDDKILYVTCDGPSGIVCIINLNTKAVNKIASGGHTPCAPTISPDGKTLYVCNRFNAQVVAIDLTTRKVIATIPVLREPVAAALTPDGATLAIANLLPYGPSIADQVSGSVTLINSREMKLIKHIALPNGSTSLRGVAISPDGQFAYVTHILARYQLPTTQVDRGWMNTNAVSIIDLTKQSLLNTVLLDLPDRGSANPWAIAVSGDGNSLVITLAGTQQLLVLDRLALHDRLTKAANNQKVTEITSSPDMVPNDFTFLNGLRRWVDLPGNGVRCLALCGKMAYAGEYFTDELAFVDLAPTLAVPVSNVPLGQLQIDTMERKGERAFCDANSCFQHWQSCATCHPDTRMDGLNWDLLNDGIGNPKNTRSMLLSFQTPPSMSLGEREDAAFAVRSGFKFIQYTAVSAEDASAVDAYLTALKPTPSPYLLNGKLSVAAERGKTLFVKAGCADCHPPNHLFTNMKMYDVGTGEDIDIANGKLLVDTPTLVEAWRTAPYLLDGRAATIEEVLTKFNPNDKHGTTSKLSKQEVTDLSEYVLSQ